MTPPAFQIGDEVEIIGPSRSGECRYNKMRFTVDMIWKHETEGFLLAPAGTMPWYPASSLRLVEPELKIGDYAEVVLEGNQFTGKIGQVSSVGELTAVLYDMGCWDKSHVRKLSVEEVKEHLALKIGDLVEIVGQPCGLERKPIGMTCKVLGITRDGNYELADWIYPASSLRKLTPEEVEQHTSLKLSQEAKDKISELVSDAITGKNTIGINERPECIKSNEINDMWDCIDEIEEHQKDQDRLLHAIAGRCAEDFSELRKRIDFIEAFQKAEVCDDCKPPEGQISVSIQRGKNEVHGISYSECPMECLEWCKTVLDSMKKGGLRT